MREHWSSKLGFLFAAVGSAVGLGVLWKFPYTVGQNGGGLFLLTYFICILVIGVPVLIGELMLGRQSQRAAIGAYAVLAPEKSGWKVAGWFGVLSSFLIMAFYSVIAGWGMSYIIMSLSGLYNNTPTAEIPELFTKLSHSGGISLFWHFLFTLITMGIVFMGVRKGIEFWSKIMTRALFVLLLGLFFYNIRLDGFSDAARFVFCPNEGGFKFSSALEALGLAFFTLSLGQGIMISYGSYMRKSDNIAQMACVVGFAVVIVATLAAMTIFPVTFTFNLPPQQGTGLIFKTLPYLFAHLPGALVVSTLFFVLFVFTALTSAVPFIEVITTNVMELVGWTRKRAVLFVAAGTFLFGVPCALSYSRGLFPSWQQIYGLPFIDTINDLVSTWLIPIGGFLTAAYVGWILKRDVSREAFSEGKKGKVLHSIWHFFMRWLIPAIIILIILQRSGLIDFDQLFKGTA